MHAGIEAAERHALVCVPLIKVPDEGMQGGSEDILGSRSDTVGEGRHKRVADTWIAVFEPLVGAQNWLLLRVKLTPSEIVCTHALSTRDK